MANNSDIKKYLDKEGLKHFASILGNYPDNAILAAVIDAISNTITENSRQYRAYIDSKMNEVREYVNSYHLADMTINITMADGSAVPDGVYVTVYNLDNGNVYANVQFTGSPIVLKDILVGFNYSVSVSEIDGYTADNKTGTITGDTNLVFSYESSGKIYGVSWKWATKDNTKLTRTGDAASFADPVPYMSGSSSYGSPFDNIYPWSHMSIVEDPNAGTVVSIPKYWFKITDTTDGIKIEIANYAAEGFKVSPAHRDRGDGKGERDIVYVGRYCCDSTYKSTTGVKPKTRVTRSNFRNYIHKLGSNIYQIDFAMFWTIRMLYIVEFANWNSQKIIGYGSTTSTSSSVMGYTDSMPYHTGTVLSSRSKYGVGTQYRYIEGLWDNIGEWCDGIYINANNNIYAIMNPNNFSDTNNGTLVGTRSSGDYGYIYRWGISTVDGFDWVLYPASIKTSETASSMFVTDFYGYYNNSNTGKNVVLYTSSSGSATKQRSGIFSLSECYYSYSNNSVGSRLMVLP